LRKFTGIHSKSRGTSYDGDKKTPLSYETFIDGSKKGRIVTFDEDNKISAIEVINGKDVWEKYASQEAEKLSGEKPKDRLEFICGCWVTQLFPLTDPEFPLSVIDETEVSGRKAVGILVKHDNTSR
jgi:hypothetical protein